MTDGTAEPLAAAIEAALNDRITIPLSAMVRHNVRVWIGLDEQIYGREALTDRIMALQAAFPDLSVRLAAVVSAAERNGETSCFFRWDMSGTNLGFSGFGPPTSRMVNIRGMACFHLHREQVIEAWIAADDGTLLEQLAHDENRYFQSCLEPEPVFAPVTAGETERTLGQDLPNLTPYPGTGNAEAFVRSLIETAWNGRSPGIAADLHDPDCLLTLPALLDRCTSPGTCARDRYGVSVAVITAMFPDIRAFIDEILTFESDEDVIVAVRWTLQGTHSREGIYGPAAFRQLTIPVLSQFRVREGAVTEEQVCFSEHSVRKKLARSNHSAEPPD